MNEYKVTFDVGTKKQTETIDAFGDAEAYAKAVDFARANFLGCWAIRSLEIK